MKTLLCSILILLGVPAFGATVKYYDDYPNNSNPPGTYIVSLQTGDKSIGGTPYNFWTLNQMVAWLQLRGFTNGGGIVITIVTNNTLINTNIIIATSNAYFNQVFETNVTVVVPGGFTNLTVTPETVAYWDINSAASSIPNAVGVLTNNGVNFGFSSTFSLSEIDAQNAYLTNTFLIGQTNKLLSTDGNGQVTNAVIGAGLTFTANQLVATGVTSLADATNEVTRQINSGTNIYASLGTAISDVSKGTNLSYIMGTNNGGGNAIVAGAPGTGVYCILTNITADTTLKAFTFWTAGLSVIPVYCSVSGGANKQLKFPANFQGAGDLYGVDLNGTGDTVTNGEAKWYEVRCIYGVKTNVFHSSTK